MAINIFRLGINYFDTCICYKVHLQNVNLSYVTRTLGTSKLPAILLKYFVTSSFKAKILSIYDVMDIQP